MFVLTEHQRTEDLSDQDLVCLSPAGFAHLGMVQNTDYLAACSEDTWYGDLRLAEAISERIGQHGPKFHYSRETTVANANNLVNYLAHQLKSEVAKPFNYLEGLTESVSGELMEIREILAEKQAEEQANSKWPEVEGKFIVGQVYPGTVDGKRDFGAFVRLDGGPTGLLHITKMPVTKTLASLNRGQTIKVKVLSINPRRKRMEFAYAE
jgi:transcriptional accessory protein Tex/SPT6